jgi:hypothetical protein
MCSQQQRARAVLPNKQVILPRFNYNPTNSNANTRPQRKTSCRAVCFAFARRRIITRWSKTKQRIGEWATVNMKKKTLFSIYLPQICSPRFETMEFAALGRQRERCAIALGRQFVIRKLDQKAGGKFFSARMLFSCEMSSVGSVSFVIHKFLWNRGAYFVV